MILCFEKFLCCVSPYFYCVRLIGHYREQTSRVMASDADVFKDGSALTVPD